MLNFKCFVKFLSRVLQILMVLMAVLPLMQLHAASEEVFKLDRNTASALHFTENTTTRLETDWAFYPRQFIVQPSTVLKSQLVHLPASFKTLTGTNTNYGTFIGYFKIPKEFIGRRIAIQVPNQYGAYRAYLNGEMILKLGEVSKTSKGQLTEKAPRMAYFIAKEQLFMLTIQASNYTHLHGGLEKPMRIGLARTVNLQFQRLMMSIAMVCGAVFGLGTFTVLFSIFRGKSERNSRTVFVFGVFIVFLALHNLFSAPYAYTMFTNIDWLWGTRFEYLFTHCAILLFITYIYLLNERYINRFIYYVGAIFLIINITATLTTQPEFFERLALYSAIYGLIILANLLKGLYQTLLHHEPYSMLNLFAVMFLCVTFLNDYLLLIDAIESIHLSFVSTSFYALLIMFQQSHYFARQSLQTEQLNLDLRELNQSLDHKVRQRTQQLNALNEKLEWQINIDALTGAFNRRALNVEIQRHFDDIKTKSEGTLVFAMLDVDYFKNYNDFYGHLKGDDVLQNLVTIIQLALPESAYVARYGGEEFAVLLRDIPIEQVQHQLEHILKCVRAERIAHDNRPDKKNYVTVSIGAACMVDGADYPDIHSLMKAADVQLYQAKNSRDELKMESVC